MNTMYSISIGRVRCAPAIAHLLAICCRSAACGLTARASKWAVRARPREGATVVLCAIAPLHLQAVQHHILRRPFSRASSFCSFAMRIGRKAESCATSSLAAPLPRSPPPPQRDFLLQCSVCLVLRCDHSAKPTMCSSSSSSIPPPTVGAGALTRSMTTHSAWLVSRIGGGGGLRVSCHLSI